MIYVRVGALAQLLLCTDPTYIAE